MAAILMLIVAAADWRAFRLVRRNGALIILARANVRGELVRVLVQVIILGRALQVHGLRQYISSAILGGIAISVLLLTNSILTYRTRMAVERRLP